MLNLFDMLRAALFQPHARAPHQFSKKNRKKTPKGVKGRRVKSALTGAMIPATKDGYPCARRPMNYDHGPGGRALKRREAAAGLRKFLGQEDAR